MTPTDDEGVVSREVAQFVGQAGTTSGDVAGVDVIMISKDGED